MATKGSNLLLILSLFSYFSFIIFPSHSFTDTILQGQTLRNWDLISASNTFTLGFFSPGTSNNLYLGIRYGDIGNTMTVKRRAPVWVANRNEPIFDPTPYTYLIIDEFGSLKISYMRASGTTQFIVLSSAQTAKINASATLLDSGNLVLRELNSDGSIKRVLWQSFDYPTDTLLSGMKLGMNLKTGHTWSLTSWINDKVPALGTFTLGLDPNDKTQLIIWWQGKVYWTSGLLNGRRFKFLPQAHNIPCDPIFSYVSNENERYLTLSVGKSVCMLEYRMDSRGVLWESGIDSFGSCLYNSKGNKGCVKQKLPECRNHNDQLDDRKSYASNDGFWFDKSYNLSLFDCHDKCMKDCSCAAYASTYDDQTGCQIWSQETWFSDDINSKRVIHVLHKNKDAADGWKWPFIVLAGVLVIIALCSSCYLIQRKLRKLIREEVGKSTTEQEILLSELEVNTRHSSNSRKTKILKRNKKKSHELQIFSFESIASATNNFSTTNKLGQGGYGPVYKGKLEDGQEIAIKRLSTNSGQGIVEFKNELKLISKLQHTKLVRLVGCCIQREEKILVYEYMPNKSLDFFLFDSTRKNLLDWKKRFNIIEGIAQGLLYLHKYSRFRVIHRDLKVSNILLDNEMNPKISDFGLARMFGGNESEANTNRVVGTYGYISPEYVREGRFSMKSDVFSFGVMLLEIVSGRKNNSYYQDECPTNLIGYAWELWMEDKVLELLDPTLAYSNHNNEALRCIHVGLLCVQDSPADRPTMSNVVSMINNETIPLSAPKQPAFFTGRNSLEPDIVNHNLENYSLNKVSITEMGGR